MALMRGKKISRYQMIFQMYGAEPSLSFADLSGQSCQGIRRYGSFSKGTIQFAFVRDQSFTHRHGFRFHFIIEKPHTLPQRGAKLKLVREFEYVKRSWIAVQFGCEGKAHAATGTQIRDLLFAQGFNGAVLQTRVGCMTLLMLCRRQTAKGKDRYGCNG
jgi:hypothetical protein